MGVRRNCRFSVLEFEVDAVLDGTDALRCEMIRLDAERFHG